MSKNKNFSDTSVGRYSLALYELSEENKNTEEIENNSLSLIKLITGSKELSNIIIDNMFSLLFLRNVHDSVWDQPL